MGTSNFFYKDPEAVLDYGINFTNWLNDGDVLSAVEWDVPAGLVEEGSAFDPGGETALVLSGGTEGVEYKVTAHITTTPGNIVLLEDDRTIRIKMVHK